MNPFVDIISLIRREAAACQQGGLFTGKLVQLEPLALSCMDTVLPQTVRLPKGIDMTQIKGGEQCVFLLDQDELLVLALY